jgi:hypothetical protein
MPLIAQICMVVVTIAMVGVAVMAIRLMLKSSALIERAHSSLAELPELIKGATRASARADELLLAFSHITRSARAGVSQFEDLATRSSTLASTLLNQVERPISQAAGVIRGVRSAVNHLLQCWGARAGGRSRTHASDDQAGDERWLDDGGAPAGNGREGQPGA